MAPEHAPLGVALIGFGYAGSIFHAPLLRGTPRLVLRAVASRDPAKVQAALSRAPGDQPAVRVVPADALWADASIRLVVIATPNDSHAPLAEAALRAGKHVVIDKPLAVTLEQATALHRQAEAAGLLLSVFHNRRWDGDFLTLRALLAEGRLGRIVEFQSNFDRYRPQVRDRWRERATQGGGLWLDLGAHLVDQALQLFGWPAAVHLDLACVRDGAQTDDLFSAMLRWDQGPFAGLRARLHASALAARPGPRFLVHGTRGSAQIDGLDDQEARLKGEPVPTQRARLWLAQGDQAEPCKQVLPLLPGDYPAYYAGVANSLLDGTACPVSAASALQVQQVLSCGEESARQGRALPLGPPLAH